MKKSPPATRRSYGATGFLARNYHESNRNIWLDAAVEHTAKAFLGVTLNCARCHDHKYDPIAQAEYYRFRAIFEPHNVRTDRLPGHADLLDWLAVELMDNGWSMKHLHRLIVTSRTWQLASSTGTSSDSRNVPIDRDNHYLWRANVRRLGNKVSSNDPALASQALPTLR